MWRALWLLLVLAATLKAAGGLVAGIHYAEISHKASHDSGISNGRSAWGPGFMIGYDAESYRMIVTRSTPDFKSPQRATLTTLSAHLIDHEDSYLRGFIGLSMGKLDYRHAAQSSSSEIDLYGVELGLILLDDRYERTQMELGYRYLKTYGSMPEGLSMGRLSALYVGFNFHFF